MKLQLDAMGRITKDFPAKFFRVETWNTGRRVADFDNRAEAEAFAIEDAKVNGCRFDHKVSVVSMTGR